MSKTAKPGILTGLLVGGLVSIAFVAILYLAAQLLGTPFVPFDVFDWVGRVLPGALITFGIDTMVSIIRGQNLGETSSAAKTAEQILAISGLIGTGIVGGGVLFAALNRMEVKARYVPGMILGLVVGVPVMFISRSVNLTATADPLIGTVWILVAFVLWGMAINWAYYQLTAPAPVEAEVPADSVTQIDRRQFLINLGGVTAAITVVGSGIGALLGNAQPESSAVTEAIAEGGEFWSASNPLPNADAVVVAAPGTRPEFTPVSQHYRIDINALPPTVREADWTLAIDGLVEAPIDMTLDDLRNNYEPLSQFVTMACISNPLGGDLTSTQRWTGARLSDVLKDVRFKPEATHLRITAVDNFDEVIDLETVMNDDRIMLTYAWDDLPLPVRNGFPLRIYIPNHYGMKQPKWINRIEAIDSWEEGYWVRRGWDKDAIMRATSVIDTVAVDDVITDGDQRLVPVGGMAHAGDRGISKVEVRVDNGEWTTTQLRTPLSETTWVIWRYDWPFQAGNHTFAVRCYDGKGQMQIETVQGSRPSGATGIDSVNRSL